MATLDDLLGMEYGDCSITYGGGLRVPGGWIYGETFVPEPEQQSCQFEITHWHIGDTVYSADVVQAVLRNHYFPQMCDRAASEIWKADTYKALYTRRN